MDLSKRSDQDLLSDVTKLVGSHRELAAKLVAHLAEIEERRLHLVAGFSSMFDFCQRKLRLSEGEAFRRILAARLGRRFPVVYSLLASGSVNLSTLQLLREWLTEENQEELFEAVAGKSKSEVQTFLATRFPRPDRPSRIHRQASIEPLSEARFFVEFTASTELREKLELCRDLMSHANPSRDLGVVIERAADLLLAELEGKRLGRTKRPRREPRGGMRRRSRVTNATRREVYERDGVQCTYVAEDGRRCEARAFLELDHAEPKALGGSNNAQNLRVRCRAHNQLWAEQAFGRDLIDHNRNLRWKKLKRRPGESASSARARSGNTQPATPAQQQESETLGSAPAHQKPQTPIAAVLEKVHSALRCMGFRDEQARRALAVVVKMHDANETLALERALREALLVATAA